MGMILICCDLCCIVTHAHHFRLVSQNYILCLSCVHIPDCFQLNVITHKTVTPQTYTNCYPQVPNFIPFCSSTITYFQDLRIFSSASMLLAEIMVRCGLAPVSVRLSGVRPSSQLSLRQNCTYLVLTSSVGCSSR